MAVVATAGELAARRVTLRRRGSQAVEVDMPTQRRTRATRVFVAAPLALNNHPHECELSRIRDPLSQIGNQIIKNMLTFRNIEVKN